MAVINCLWLLREPLSAEAAQGQCQVSLIAVINRLCCIPMSRRFRQRFEHHAIQHFVADLNLHYSTVQYNTAVSI